MFKVGDKVMCVNINSGGHSLYTDSQPILPLKLNDIYTINFIHRTEVGCIEKSGFLYNKNRFKLLSEIRKEKLNKLCSR